MKLDPAGNVLFSTYFGGNGNETVANAICLDASGNIYLGGTTGPNSDEISRIHFRLQPAPRSPVPLAGSSPNSTRRESTLVYSTLLPARVVAMAIDLCGRSLYRFHNRRGCAVSNDARSLSTRAACQSEWFGRGRQAECVRPALLYATYLSGNGLTTPQGIAIDAAGDAFVAGYTQAADFPVTPGAFQTSYFPSAGYMEFVSKLNPQGTGLVYSTFLGATPNMASQIKVDAQGGAYVLALGGAELASGGYLSHLSADGSELVYSTYIPTVTGLGLDLDSAGSAFVAGVSGTAMLATSPGAFQSGSAGNTGSDVSVAKFTSNGQFAGATYAYVSPTAGGGPLITLAPSGAIMLAQGAPNWTVIGIFPWLTAQNTASGVAGVVAPGELVTLRGYGLGPATAAAGSGGTQVTFGGVAAPVFSAQAQQITVQVPWEIAGQTSSEVLVAYGGQTAVAAAPVVVAKAAPGIFAVTDSDGTVNSASHPAKAGDSITIYGTGGGVTNPLGITGGLWPVGASLPTLALPVSVTIGGTNAMVLYAGSAPTLESGYFQVNVALPSGLQPSPVVCLGVAVGGSSGVAVPIYIQ